MRIHRLCPFLYTCGQFLCNFRDSHHRYFHVWCCFWLVCYVIHRNKTSLLVTLLALNLYFFYRRIHRLCPFLYVCGQILCYFMKSSHTYFYVWFCFHAVYKVIYRNKTSLLVTLLALKFYLFCMRIHLLCPFLYMCGQLLCNFRDAHHRYFHVWCCFWVVYIVIHRNKTSLLVTLLALNLYFFYRRIHRLCPFLYVCGQILSNFMDSPNTYFHAWFSFHVVYNLINWNKASLIVTLLALKLYFFCMRTHRLCLILYVWNVPVQFYDSPP